jgi:hypothetical protein
MIPALEHYPRFEKGSPSSEYQQIINFCTNYLEGMLVGLMHQEVNAGSIENPQQIEKLQQRMLARERTIRHAFQFQIEKYFTDFKSISRTRLRISRSDDNQIFGLSSHKAAQIYPAIQTLSRTLQQSHHSQLTNTSVRLKKLVHRSDGNSDDNPISPLKLYNAFQASIDTLGLTVQKNLTLLQLFDLTLKNQLENFYQQIDLGFYYLDILPGLTDPDLFVSPELEKPPTTETPDDGDPFENIPQNTEQPEWPAQQSKVSALRQQREKKQQNEHDLAEVITQFKFDTENGTLHYDRLFADVTSNIKPLLPAKHHSDVDRFATFFTSLLNNSLVSTPLKTQLSRLSCPLLQLVLIDPFFFRSSAHPVNDFLHSIIDFELRFKHQGNSLLYLSRIIDDLLVIEQPGLSDYQPLIQRYESFKTKEDQRLTDIREAREYQQQQLKKQLLEMINDITAELLVEQETMQFFYDDWQLHLLQLANEAGLSSKKFRTAIEQARMLSWMLDENKSGEHPDFPEISFKTLLKEIDKCLHALNFSGEHRTRIRKQLVHEFKQANRQPSFAFIPSAATSTRKVQLAHDSTQPISPEDFARMQTPTLKRGDWVEIRKKAQERPQRAKLQWVSNDKQQFIFTSQNGHKVHECNLLKLETELANGLIKPLRKPRLNEKFSSR